MVIAVGPPAKWCLFCAFFSDISLKAVGWKAPNGLEEIICEMVKENSKKFGLEYAGMTNYNGQVEI